LNDTVKKTRNGAIVYDTEIINQISDAAFSSNSWPHTTPVTGALRSAGRGNTMIVGRAGGEFVLRHYLRGGLPGRLIRDAYLWTGERQTRAFAEWYLLSKLVRMGLPVPRPAAACSVAGGSDCSGAGRPAIVGRSWSDHPEISRRRHFSC
jgi:3-deoxy-D-manno-octulosonic acid kinase